MKLIIINGPNLNLLGQREQDIYGTISFEEFFESVKLKFPKIDISYYQSNSEGQLIDKLHECGFSYDGIIINCGGYTHSSIAIMDAIGAITTPVLEVHISNIHARESFRTQSFPAKKCIGVIAGLGLNGYELAVSYFSQYI